MTADIRTAAEREALAHRVHQDMEPGEHWGIVEGFADGAAWAAERVTPTHTQFLHTLVTHPYLPDKPDGRGFRWGRCACGEKFQGGQNSPNYATHLADELVALMAGLAEGEGA